MPISLAEAMLIIEGAVEKAEELGVPVIRNGFIEGGCDVGGSIPPQDEECATAGVKKLMGGDYIPSIY